MSVFDALDAATAAAVDRSFSDIVIWRPRLVSKSFTAMSHPDPTRPRRDLPAIISWAPTDRPVQQSPGGGAVAVATLVVDFERALFHTEELAPFGVPQQDDWIEMPTEPDPANRVVVITSTKDDRSARFYAYCSLVPRR